MKSFVEEARLNPLLAPQSITVIGASTSRNWATGNQVIRNLQNTGFSGHIQILNPAEGQIENIPVTTTTERLIPTDTAVIAVGPDAVMQALVSAHAAQIPSAIVMSVGLEQATITAIKDFSQETGMSIHGPNCMGIINVPSATTVWADEGILVDLPPGNVSLISQSGSGAIFVARSMSGVGFDHIISTGNEAALPTSDYLTYLAAQPSTEVIGIIVESIHDANEFAEAVHHVKAAGKPIVALKVGRSAAGAAATVAHTGALLADDAIVAAFFDRIGVPLVADYDELAASLELVSHAQGREFGMGRTGVLTISGGQAALAADLAEAKNAHLATFSKATTAALTAVLPGLQVQNPLDAGGSVHADDDYFEESLRLVSEDPNVDVVVAITDSQSTLTDIEIEYEDSLIEETKRVASRHAKPFLIASSSSLTLHPSRISHPDEPVAAVRGIGNAFTAIKAASLATAASKPSPKRPEGLPTVERVRELLASLPRNSGPIDQLLAEQILREYGIPFVRSSIATTKDEAIKQSQVIGYPLVLKVASADIAHRSDVGGVVTGISSQDELLAAWGQIEASVAEHQPKSKIVGMELQEQVHDALEAFVGAISDPHLGSIVAVGLGGVLVELIDDATHMLAPVGTSEARGEIEASRLGRLLSGYRNLHPVTTPDHLAEVLVKVSWLMADLGGRVSACDFNPVLVESGTGRITLVDSLIIVRDPSS